MYEDFLSYISSLHNNFFRKNNKYQELVACDHEKAFAVLK